MVAEQFGEAIEMEAITRAAKYGRMTGEIMVTGNELVFYCAEVEYSFMSGCVSV